MRASKAILKLAKLLTFLFAVMSAQELFSASITQEKAKTHLRWNISSSRKNLVIDKKGQHLLLKTLNLEFYTKLKKDLGAISSDRDYINAVSFIDPSSEGNVSTVKVQLAGSNVEFFTFYKDKERQYVIDFWKDTIDAPITAQVTTPVNTVEAEKSKRVPASIKAPKIVPKEPIKVATPTGVANVSKKSVTKEITKVEKKATPKVAKVKKTHRDFRYGTPFYWDYDPLPPKFKDILDIRSKTPEFFYPIKDREYNKNDKEAHLQLSINLFRKKKWGLMYKSITLYEGKYRKDDSFYINEYLKANALLRADIDKGKALPSKAAINILKNLEESSPDYDLKTAVSKYLLQYYIKNKEYVTALRMAKSLFIASKKEFDYSEAKLAMEATLFSLSQLNQLGKVREILSDKKYHKYIAKGKAINYKIYTHIKFGEIDDVIKIYEKNKRSLAKPIHQSTLFNVAEAYFRKGNFARSLSIYDDFIATYSYDIHSSKARVRLALIFEILGKRVRETEILYRNAINRIPESEENTEARIRYVALRNTRKINISKEDIESRIFLRIDNKKTISKRLKKILWITRLRIFLVDKEYNKALAYLKAIPLDSLKPSEARVFRADGAEAVYGLINKYHANENYSKVVGLWNMYKDSYLKQTSTSYSLHLLLGQSYLRLGLYDLFDKIHNKLSTSSVNKAKNYPIWVKRGNSKNLGGIYYELRIVKHMELKNWDLADKAIHSLSDKNPENRKINYYRGLLSYYKGDYKKSVSAFENFLVKGYLDSLLNTSEVVSMVSAYTESIHNTGDIDKFLRVSKAILSDLDRSNIGSKSLKRLKEKIAYINIEIIYGRKTKESYLMMESEIEKFLSSYKKSTYQDRLRYLLGLSYINSNRVDKGKKILSEIVKKEGLSSYIKKLAKSELATIAIKEKTL